MKNLYSLWYSITIRKQHHSCNGNNKSGESN